MHRMIWRRHTTVVIFLVALTLVVYYSRYNSTGRLHQPGRNARRLSKGEILKEGECLRNGNAAACVRKGVIEITVEGEETFRSSKRRRWWGNGRAEVVDGDLVVWERQWLGMIPHRASFSTKTSKGDYLWLSREGTLKLYSEGLLFDSVVWSLDECKPPPEPLNLSSSPSSSTADVDIATGAQIHQIETFPGTEFSVECIGVGMRAKPIMGLVSVNIYTVALYVEREEIKKGLKGGGKSLSSSPLTNELLNGSFRMVAHLDFVRTVGVDNVADGLSSLKGVADEPLAAFRKAIVESVGTEIKARETISLVWLQHSELLVIVRGQIATKIVDSNLPAAVFDLYLGEDPVSLPAKRSFEDGLKKILP